MNIPSRPIDLIPDPWQGRRGIPQPWTQTEGIDTSPKGTLQRLHLIERCREMGLLKFPEPKVVTEGNGNSEKSFCDISSVSTADQA
jgi:hypothetical protein